MTTDENLQICNLVQQGLTVAQAKERVLGCAATVATAPIDDDEDEKAEIMLQIEEAGGTPVNGDLEALTNQLEGLQAGL